MLLLWTHGVSMAVLCPWRADASAAAGAVSMVVLAHDVLALVLVLGHDHSPCACVAW